jgi:MFS family permease
MIPASYAALFRKRYVKYLIVTNLFGRLSDGMGPLAIVLFLRSEGIDYAIVGSVASIYAVSRALGAPVLARRVDRRAAHNVLLVSAVACGAGFAGLGIRHEPIAAVVVAAAVAGFFSPPLEASLRSMWPSILSDNGLVAVAYALDTSLQQVLFIVGPLIVSALSAIAADVPLLVIAIVTVSGTICFAVSAPVREWRAVPGAQDWVGPLRSATVRRQLGSFLAIGCVLGVLNVAVVAYAEHAGMKILAGELLGAHAVGALAGGLGYGARTWGRPARDQILFLLVCLAASYWLLSLVAAPVIMLAFMAIAGVFLAPVLTCGFLILGEVAPAGTATEAFAWLIAMVGIGNAAGSGIAGLVTQDLGLKAAFLLPGLAGSVAVLIAVYQVVSARREMAREAA